MPLSLLFSTPKSTHSKFCRVHIVTKCISLFLLLTTIALPIFAEQQHTMLTGKIFDNDAQKHIFDWQTQITMQASRLVFEASFRNAGNQSIIAHERYEKNADGSGHYRYVRDNTGEIGEVKWQGNTLTQRLVKEGNEVIRHKKIKGELVVGPGLFIYIAKHIAALNAGEKRIIYLAVPELTTVIKFELKVSQSEDLASSDEFTVRMRPTNFLYRIFSDTVYFQYKKGQPIPYRSVMSMLPLLQVDDDYEHVQGSLLIEDYNHGRLKTLLRMPIKTDLIQRD